MTTVCITPLTLGYPQGGGHLWCYLNWVLPLRALGLPRDLARGHRRARGDEPESARREPHRHPERPARGVRPGRRTRADELQRALSSTQGSWRAGPASRTAAAEADLLLDIAYDTPHVGARAVPAHGAPRPRPRPAPALDEPGQAQRLRATTSTSRSARRWARARPASRTAASAGTTRRRRSSCAAWPVTEAGAGRRYTTVTNWWEGWIELDDEPICNDKRARVPSLRGLARAERSSRSSWRSRSTTTRPRRTCRFSSQAAGPCGTPGRRARRRTTTAPTSRALGPSSAARSPPARCSPTPGSATARSATSPAASPRSSSTPGPSRFLPDADGPAALSGHGRGRSRDRGRRGRLRPPLPAGARARRGALRRRKGPAARAGARSRVSRIAVLGYHKVGPPGPGAWETWFYVPEDVFAAHLTALRDGGWQPVDGATFLRGLAEPGDAAGAGRADHVRRRLSLGARRRPAVARALRLPRRALRADGLRRPHEPLRRRERARGAALRLGRAARAGAPRSRCGVARGFASHVLRAHAVRARTRARALEGCARGRARADGSALSRTRTATTAARRRRCARRAIARPSATAGDPSRCLRKTSIASSDSRWARTAIWRRCSLARKRLVLAGIVGRYPVGGVTWCALQYIAGFQRLGYDVFYRRGHRRVQFRPGRRTRSRPIPPTRSTTSAASSSSWGSRTPGRTSTTKAATTARRKRRSPRPAPAPI